MARHLLRYRHSAIPTSPRTHAIQKTTNLLGLWMGLSPWDISFATVMLAAAGKGEGKEGRRNGWMLELVDGKVGKKRESRPRRLPLPSSPTHPSKEADWPWSIQRCSSARPHRIVFDPFSAPPHDALARCSARCQSWIPLPTTASQSVPRFFQSASGRV